MQDDFKNSEKNKKQSKDEITVTHGNTLATLQSIAGIIKHDTT